MSHVHVRLSAEPAEYRTGAVLEGEAAWTLDEPVASLDLKVYWTTDGDFGVGAAPVVVQTQTIPVSALEGKQSFRLDLPQGPWSFQGKLFSVRWYVELSRDESYSARTEFVLGPEGKALGSAPQEPLPSWGK